MCSFLVSAQETNQRKRPGEALSAKSFAAAAFGKVASPTLSHPPPAPLPALVGSWVPVDFIIKPSTLRETHPESHTDTHICLKKQLLSLRQPSVYHSDYKKSFDGGRERYIGEGVAERSGFFNSMIAGGNHTATNRLEVGVEEAVYGGSSDRLRGQRLPYADFFGYFLVQRQESDTYRRLDNGAIN